VGYNFNLAVCESIVNLRYNQPDQESSVMSEYIETRDQGLKHLLLELETEHAELDKQVAGYSKAAGFDQILLRRMKRRKLSLPDL